MNSNSPVGDYRRNSFTDDDPLGEEPTIWRLIIQEARAVSLWSCLSTILRLCLVLLSLMASYQYGQEENCNPTIANAITEISSLQQPLSATTHERLLVASGLAGLLLYSAPWKVATLQAPGFSFANPWLMLWIRDKTGVVPNLPIRMCEYMLDRLSLFELLVILPIHVVAIVSTSVFLWRVLPDSLASLALEPVEYSSDGHLWIVDLVREVCVSAIFAVSLLVLPVLFQLNHIPRWTITFILYPLFNYGIDGKGKASTFSPNVVLALAVLGHQPLPSTVGLLGSLIGGLVAGRVMQWYFPDDNHKKSA